ncbi:TetR family transcriptional regulator [Alkalibaculum sp. M08DMB]|uniref:TetR family transcriptional regulator n=1 Tax=Alkalibaculum sporogenes TaxID=2655001 RepID=A0A6A7K510_9FIRM|nr:TetR/AcrR family transcriptional regulator [Alkalibaculum sporogenes]MPW24414.1 TetR family transcriptional regulator [Alkalibaculum sporogenes]
MRTKDDEKQKSIKNAVIKLILERGFHGTSISKIAKLAGISPATVYIYYENKEEMMRDIYEEYAYEVFEIIQKRVTSNLTGEQLIEIILYEYYYYIMRNRETFHFTEQFSNCPSLQKGCNTLKVPTSLNNILSSYKERGILIDYKNENIWALLIYPIKAIALNSTGYEISDKAILREMVTIIQNSLLL